MNHYTPARTATESTGVLPAANAMSQMRRFGNMRRGAWPVVVIRRDRQTARLVSTLVVGGVFALAAVVALVVHLRTNSVGLTIVSVGICSVVFIIGGFLGVLILGGAEGLALVRGRRPDESGDGQRPQLG